VRDLIASLKEQFGNVAEPELVAQPPEDRQQDDVGGELEIIEGRAGALVEAAATGPRLFERSVCHPRRDIADAKHGVRLRCLLGTVSDSVPPERFRLVTT
jgi:hypothetical protein